LSNTYTSLTLTWYATLFGVIWLLGMVWMEDPIPQLMTISTDAIVSIIYMGVGASGIGYLLYNLSIRQLGLTQTSSAVYSMVPVFVAILANLFFNQSVNNVMLASMSLTMIALYLVLKTEKASH
jgi:drug/metabolite transporter (DMT)-like permease